ncbi:MAG: DUF5996 family protein [Deferribacteraceae bacterium]|jgi:hypothetical protein|nr:DUF5996 family protein [Deferribacteraceae bacterium]
MNVLKYSEWRETALTLHLILQMLGKVKLERMQPQPEWNHALLQLTPYGFTTGLIPNGDKSFSISVSIRESRVITTGLDGYQSSFALDTYKSTDEYFAAFNRMLDLPCKTEINTMPQEMSVRTPFEKHTEPRVYSCEAAMDFFRMCVFAHNVEMKFTAGFRGKKILPTMFWGTFDVSSVLFSGKPAPFPGKGVIEEAAFDEQMIEFGFWPGDNVVDEPSFFILPYPFIKADLSAAPIRPSKAWFSKEKMEYFITLRDIMSYPSPEDALYEFFLSGFEIITKHEQWANLDWFCKPI